MTTRHAGYIVTLEQDLRDDDAKTLIDAIELLRGVVSVQPIVAEYLTHVARERIRRELVDKLWQVLYPRKDE